ncbi:hypothetical protein HY488_02765 [Candidatus Woesearchaeota archaeon]|nr:hypothetical protein [Candidatus Woesearchaeota archaeon]
MRERKAQAAMEFLMTYGWAILVVLVVIGALAYFGVLSPGRLLPDRCQLPPGISCDDYSVAGGVATIIVTNGQAGEIQVTEFKAASPDLVVDCPVDPLVVYPVVVAQSGVATLTTTCTGLPSTGTKQRLQLTLKYRLGATGLEHTMQGDMYTTVS